MAPSLRVHPRSLTAIALALAAASPAQQFVRQPVPSDTGQLAHPIQIDAGGLVDFVTLTTQSAIVRRNLGGSRFATGTATSLRRLVLPFPGALAPAADFDGDGDQDLLVLTADGGFRGALMRNGAGTLADAVPVTPPLAQTSQVAIAVFDADGDGDPDLWTRTLAQIALFINDGSGTFATAPAGAVPALAGAYWHVVGDLDGDGRDDLAVVANGAIQVLMARQAVLVDESAARIPAHGAVLQVAAFDIDGDGDRDLVGSLVQRPNGGLLLRNNGAGSFSSGTLLATTASDLVGNVVPADLDADGDRDLLIGRQRLRNDGTGQFVLDGLVDAPAMAAVDLDRDGLDDVISSVGVWRNQGNAGFALLSSCAGSWVGDFDGDGDPDSFGLQGYRWTQEGGTWATALSGPLRSPLGGEADLDGDGDLDRVDRFGDSVRLWVNDGSGNLAARGLLAVGNSTGQVLLLDHDGDGDVDLLYATGVDGAVPVLQRNDGNLTFTDVAAAALPSRSLPPDLFASDVDGDGDQDVVGAGPGTLLLLRNLGNGVFADASGSLPGRLAGDRLIPAQLDRDAEAELLLVGAPPAVRLLDAANGVWTVRAAAIPAINGIVPDVVPVDVDDDGDLDLVVAGTAQLLQNDGNGAFVDATVARGPVPAAARRAVDLDGDGDPDLLDGAVAWLNTQRQLEIAAPCAVGGALALEFTVEGGRAGSSGFALVTLGTVRLASPLALLGGRFFPDPRTSILAVVIPSLGGAAGSASLPIPAQPALRGLGLRIQGLVVDGRGQLRLANHLFSTIE